MRLGIFRTRVLAAVSGLIIFSCNDAGAASWLGTTDNKWEIDTNWEGGVNPNMYQTATFDNDGNNNTNILYTNSSTAIYNVQFSSPACAAYTIGSSSGQRVWLLNNGSITLDQGVVNDQVIRAYVMLGNNAGTHTITFRNDSPVAQLKLLSGMRYNSKADKLVYLKLEGVGDMLLDGGSVLSGNATARISNNASGRITFGGQHHFNSLYTYMQLKENVGDSHLTLAAGAELFLDFGASSYSIWHEGHGLIDGTGTLRFGGTASAPARLYIRTGSTLTVKSQLTSLGGLEMYNASGGGTLFLDCINTMAADLVNSSIGTVSASKIGNRGAIDSNLGQGDRVLMSGNGSTLAYTGTGETTDRIIEFSNNAVLDHSGSGDLFFTENMVAKVANKTLTLTGSAVGTGEITGISGIGSATAALRKAGSGVWRLGGSNTYGGKTTVQDGTLVLYSSNGALVSTSSIALEGGTLCISNTATANLSERINDGATINLKSGSLEFVHDSAIGTDYSESLGTLTIADYAGEIRVSQAAEGSTSTLTFASIARSGSGSVNFAGEGLGEESHTRSRIFFTTPPVLVDGFIPGAVVNGGAMAKYDDLRGVYADQTGIAARGPDSVIPDNSALHVLINAAGIEGAITLESPGGASVASLTQASATPAVVATAEKALTSGAVNIAEHGAALTIGEEADDGTLLLSSGDDYLGLVNRSTSVLTVNAKTVESVAGTGLSKSGKGQVTLNGQLNAGGDLRVNEGTLTLGPLSAASHLLGNNVVMRGGDLNMPTTLEFSGATEIYNYGNLFVGMSSGDRCVLKVDSDVAIQANPAKEGGTLRIGSGLGVAGAVIQSAGRMDVTLGMSWITFYTLGSGGGYGYHRISGGTLAGSQMVLGQSSGGSGNINSSVLEMFGGELLIDGNLLIVAWYNGASVLNIFGGSLTCPRGSAESIILGYGSGSSTSQINLLGPDARMFDREAHTRKKINLARNNGNTLGVVNLNAGELTLLEAYATHADTPSHFNFNGGLLKVAYNTTNLLHDLTAAHVFAGGARIDTDGYDATLNQGLVAPQDTGAAHIELLTGGAGYIGAPTVLITGGTAVGATAIALVDLEEGSPNCGQVTNILITNAGSGYVYNKDKPVRVALHGGGYLTPAALGSVTFTPNVSGGLTKLGAGTLTLNQACTFSGGTLVSTGTLQFGCENALLPGSSVTLEEGAILDLNGNTATHLVNGVGTVANGTLQGDLSPAGADVIGTQTLSLSNVTLSGTYTLDVSADGASDLLVINGDADLSEIQLQVVDPSQLKSGQQYAVASVSGQVQGLFNIGNLLGSKWRLKSVNGTVWLYFSDGLQLILR